MRVPSVYAFDLTGGVRCMSDEKSLTRTACSIGSMLVPLLPVYVAAPPEWWPAPPSIEETDDVCTEVGSSVETEAPRCKCDEDWQLQEVYYQPNLWHKFEEGLWLKATHMPLLDTCCVETDTDYRVFGSLGDFYRVSESMGSGLVVVGESCVHVFRKGE